MDDPVTGRWFLKSAVDSGDLVRTVTGEWQWKASCVPTTTGEWVSKFEVSSYNTRAISLTAIGVTTLYPETR